MGYPGGSDGKESACNAGHPGSIPALGRSPGEGNGNPLQYLHGAVEWMRKSDLKGVHSMAQNHYAPNHRTAKHSEDDHGLKL